jgi:hypothetical protein
LAPRNILEIHRARGIVQVVEGLSGSEEFSRLLRLSLAPRNSLEIRRTRGIVQVLEGLFGSEEFS